MESCNWCTYKRNWFGIDSQPMFHCTAILLDAANYFFFLKIFCGDKPLFCGATGTLCFGLKLTLAMVFKAKVDPSSPALCSHLHIMILRVNSEFPDQGPILHLGMVQLPRVTTQCHFWDCWLIWTHDLAAQSLMLYRLSYSSSPKPDALPTELFQRPKAWCSTDWAIPAAQSLMLDRLNYSSGPKPDALPTELFQPASLLSYGFNYTA